MRKPQPRIVNPETHPRSSVCLAVAAEFLGIHVKTLKARIDLGKIAAWQDGKVYRIDLAELRAYEARRAREVLRGVDVPRSTFQTGIIGKTGHS